MWYTTSEISCAVAHTYIQWRDSEQIFIRYAMMRHKWAGADKSIYVIVGFFVYKQKPVFSYFEQLSYLALFSK